MLVPPVREDPQVEMSSSVFDCQGVRPVAGSHDGAHRDHRRAD
jgi:hypothetical protein